MNRVAMNRVALIATMAAVSLAIALAAAAQTPEPNIVLVFMDNSPKR